MKTRVTHHLPLVLMLFLAALTVWLQYAVQGDFGGDAGASRSDPDAIVENFTVHRLGEMGKPQYTFSAPKMLHYSENDFSEVLYPRFVYPAADGGNITASANRGTVSRGSEDETLLYGDALIVREATQDRGELRARTEFLRFLPEQGIARTDRTVIITEGGSILTGVGMVVDKDKQQFSLQSQVRGIFDASKK